jgi:hypothetical protein
MCERSGWQRLEIVRDRDVGPTLERPALGYALERIASQPADGMVVSDLQHLSRSIIDLGALMAWFRDADAALVALDMDVDTSTAKGRHVAGTLITLSNHPHDRIAHRSLNGLAEFLGDRRTGRPAVRHDPELPQRIAAMPARNMTFGRSPISSMLRAFRRCAAVGSGGRRASRRLSAIGGQVRSTTCRRWSTGGCGRDRWYTKSGGARSAGAPPIDEPAACAAPRPLRAAAGAFAAEQAGVVRGHRTARWRRAGSSRAHRGLAPRVAGVAASPCWRSLSFVSSVVSPR